MKYLRGNLVADDMVSNLKKDVVRLNAHNLKLTLAVILVGNDPASELYVQKKTLQAKEVGIELELHHLPDTCTQVEIIDLIKYLNDSANITGILVQLPLPKNIDTQKVVWSIKPEKDVDGFQMRLFNPPAPMAILDLLAYYKIPLSNQKVTLVGYGMLIGKPLSVMLKKQGANLTICDNQTSDLAQKIKSADIVISAVGKPKLITKEMVSPNQIIVDAGTASEAGSTVGDVDLAEVAPIVQAITPVPGGVGPLTVVELFKNVVRAGQQQIKSN